MNSVLMNAPNPCGARLRGDHRLRDREHGRDGSGDAREPGRREHDRHRNRVGPPPDDREVEAEQQPRRQPDRARRRPPELRARQTAGERRGHQRGQRDQREQQGAVRGTQLEVAEQPQVEPEPPAEEREPHREHADRHEAQGRDLPEPRERVHGREVLVADARRRRGTPPRPRRAHGARRCRRPDTNARRAAIVVATKNATRHSAVPSKRAVVAATISGPEREADGADRHVEGEHDRPGADRERIGEERALYRDRGEHAGASEREHAEELPALERGTREHEGEHRDREQPPQDLRAVGRRAVDVVPEWLRHQHDREARQDRGRHEEAEAEVVVVGDLRREERGHREDRESESPGRAHGEQQRAVAAGEHGPEWNRVTTDTRERVDVDGEIVLRLALPPRLLVEHRGDERSGLRRAFVAVALAHVASLPPFPELPMPRNAAASNPSSTPLPTGASEPTWWSARR